MTFIFMTGMREAMVHIACTVSGTRKELLRMPYSYLMQMRKSIR